MISRRSGGLSLGVNLNPDTACNFDCIYCQVDRTITPRIRDVDLSILRAELDNMLELARTRELFRDEAFKDVPPSLQTLRDVAFSGDGEPTTCKLFTEVVDLTASLLKSKNLTDAKIVLITDACYLTKPHVVPGLEIMDRNNGEIWAKLDAGTEEYYRLINRPNYPLRHVMDNIIAAARVRPIVIQSLFMRVEGVPPSEAEITAYIDRLNEIVGAGGKISLAQVYTVARPPAEAIVTPLSAAEVDQIVSRVTNEAHLAALPFYGPP